jgi:hypothetical protein
MERDIQAAAGHRRIKVGHDLLEVDGQPIPTADVESLELRAHSDWGLAVAGGITGALMFLVAVVMTAVRAPTLFIAIIVASGLFIAAATLLASGRRVHVFELIAHEAHRSISLGFDDRPELFEHVIAEFDRQRANPASAPEPTVRMVPGSEELKALFARALELPPATRAALAQALLGTGGATVGHPSKEPARSTRG